MRFRVVAALGAAAAIAVVVGVRYWPSVRGLGPALLPPPQDITEVLSPAPTAEPTPTPQPPGNTTGFPLKLPRGFSISIFAKDLEAPRVMSWDPRGTMLVSIPASGRVVALPDSNGDGADRVVTVLQNLNRPHGLAWRCRETCELYVAESDQVAVYAYDADMFKASNKRTLVQLPDGGRHFTRTLMFMPAPNQDTLLISVGSSCDVCHEQDERRAKVLAYHIVSDKLETFAQGLRNSVFMSLHPVSGAVWATEMGRDRLGDDLPPDEVNILGAGKNYGWPTCYGKNIHDTEFDKNTYVRNPCLEPFETPSYLDLQAHSAPLGLAFIPEEGWPEDWWYDLLVAYHGSWNRTEPTGYKVVRFKLDAEGRYQGQEDFVSGWLQGSRALGRPVDILVQPGGTMYVSDDKAGVIYRLYYRP